MNYLIKTIQIIGGFSVLFQNAIFSEPSYYARRDTLPIISALKKPVAASFFAAIAAFFAASVFLMYGMVSNEYAIQRLTKNVGKEEEALSKILIVYTKFTASDEVLRSLTENKKNDLVQINEVSYIKPDSVIQANALLQLP